MLEDPGLKIPGESVKRQNLKGATYPPFNHIPHGSLLRELAGTVSDPFDFSKPMKNKVSLGWPARWTGMLPAKVRGSGNVTLGNLSFTVKSTGRKRVQIAIRFGIINGTYSFAMLG